jgi:hypothetical protein
MKSSPASQPFDRRSVIVLNNPEQLQYDEYDGNDDQNVNPIAGAREA